MGLFSKELLNVVEWEEWRDDMIFWKWSNKEIKKGSRLIIRPGQDAIFLYNGKIEGIFEDDGEYDIESQIVPFLSTLKGFKFGFNSGMRAEVLFVNTKEFTVKWGTKNPVMIPTPSLPGGLPIRANGTVNFKVSDYTSLIDHIAGVKSEYFVEDVKIRITSVLDQLLMKWISQAGKDMFNLQANAMEISNGIRTDLDMQLTKDGITVTGFNVMSFNYPEEVQKMITKTAAQSMVGDVGKYQQISMTDAMAEGKVGGGQSTMGSMAEMMMGMKMADQMLNNMNQNNMPQNNMNSNGGGAAPAQPQTGGGAAPNFCPNCGTKTEGARFCPNCGQKLV